MVRASYTAPRVGGSNPANSDLFLLMCGWNCELATLQNLTLKIMCGWNSMNLNQQQGDGIGERFNLRQYNWKLIIWYVPQ